jgi:putative adenylate-forming enzyme
MKLAITLWYYWLTRNKQFKSRQDLEQHQQKKLNKFIQQNLSKSPYFKKFINQPLSQWPIMDKKSMMKNFDVMNTEGLFRDVLMDCALKSEHSRDYKPTIGKFSVGLSSGTSGERGLFVVSPFEQKMWAGCMLGKMLPRGLFAKERVALFLRADNNLYQSVNSRWLSLNFFNLFENFNQQLQKLEKYQPTIIVAPAQVLTAIAKEIATQNLNLKPYKVISVAEILNEQDKAFLKNTFENVGEVYQATEGFLGATCNEGTLHLNEEFIHVEPEWIDEQRFIPIITDFTRTTQPIVRYRLNDVLVKSAKKCPCGSHNIAIERIEGREDDQLKLKNAKGQYIHIFADYCNRIMAQTLPLFCDYRLVQNQENGLEIIANCELSYIEKSKEKLCKYFIEQDVDISCIDWKLIAIPTIPQEFSIKKRRIISKVNI